jgi:LPXTG-motif cell wall-anchored protein
MRERAIGGGLLVGLISLAASILAFVSRNTGPCGKPESCPSLGAVNSHPYTGDGYALVAIGLIAIGLALVLAARRRTAG